MFNLELIVYLLRHLSLCKIVFILHAFTVFSYDLSVFQPLLLLIGRYSIRFRAFIIVYYIETLIIGACTEIFSIRGDLDLESIKDRFIVIKLL